MLEHSEKQIIARVKQLDDFIEGSLRQKVVDPSKGIYCFVGKLKTDGIDGGMVIQSYRFDVLKNWDVEKTKQWIDDHNIDLSNSDSISFAELSDVEIFATGKWNGREFNDNDLDNIVKSFNEIGDKIKPYVKLGHDDNQSLLQKDGLPSAGWIKRLKKVGNKLVADIKDVPRVISELIKNGAYKRISSELYIDYSASVDETGNGSKKYPLVLKAIALLGGDTPAVTNLGDIMALYTNNNDDFLSFEYQKESEEILMADKKKDEEVIEEKIEELEEEEEKKEKLQKKEEEKEMEKEEEDEEEKKEMKKTSKNTIDDQVNGILSKFEKSEDLVADIKSLLAEKEALQKERDSYRSFKLEQKKKEVEHFVSQLLEQNKIIPAQKDALNKILFTISDINKTIQFSDSNIYGLKNESSLEDAFKAFINAYPDMGLLKRFSSTETVFKNKEDECEAIIQKYMKDNNCDYGNAQAQVYRVRPELFNS